jgi:hypothetical protein
MPPASGPRKVVRKRPVVKPPAGDVASSGGDYGRKKAAPTVKRELKAIHTRQAQVKDVKSNQDLARAKTYHKAHPEILKPPKKHKGSALGAALNRVADIGAAAAFPAVATEAAVIDKAFGTKLVPGAKKAISNIPSDTAELVTTTPSSVAKLASTAVHHPEKVPGMLADPYIELAKHPGKALTEHPVTTALMVSPAVKMPGRIVGKTLRLTGKQTLERTTATLPGTALKQTRTASRDALVNAVQKRKDVKAGARTIPDKEIKRRVDEFYAAGQKHKQRVTVAATKQAKKMPEAERAEHIKGALAGAENHLNERFVKEFGASAKVTPEGAIVKPKNPTQGEVHATRQDAEAVLKRVPFDGVVRKVGEDKYAVLPRVAAERFTRHKVVGTSPAVGAKVLRSTRTMFTSTVLPLSPKWLTGNTVEAGLRSLIGGAGPTSYLRGAKVLKELERQSPRAGKLLEDRAAGGGYFGGTIRGLPRKSFEEEFAGSKLANIGTAMTKVGAKHGPKEVHELWRHVTDFVFNTLNGRMENITQKAMLGKALKNSPLMERRVVGLSDKAIAEAAKGLKGTEAQVELGRVVDRMYGRYAKFSPATREAILHWTPFAPWDGNVVTFLFKVLPVDHPVTTALLASVDASTEEWRKAAGLSLRGGKTVPGFLLGGYPASNGGFTRLARYTPFGASADPTQAVSDLFLPQLRPALDNLGGVDWRGERLKHAGYKGKEFNQAERSIRAAVTLIEAMVPGVAQAGRLTGVTPRYIDKQDKPSVFQHKQIVPALNKEFNPFAPTSKTDTKPKVKKAKKGDGWGAPSTSKGDGWG